MKIELLYDNGVIIPVENDTIDEILENVKKWLRMAYTIRRMDANIVIKVNGVKRYITSIHMDGTLEQTRLGR